MDDTELLHKLSTNLINENDFNGFYQLLTNFNTNDNNIIIDNNIINLLYDKFNPLININNESSTIIYKIISSINDLSNLFKIDLLNNLSSNDITTDYYSLLSSLYQIYLFEDNNNTIISDIDTKLFYFIFNHILNTNENKQIIICKNIINLKINSIINLFMIDCNFDSLIWLDIIPNLLLSKSDNKIYLYLILKLFSTTSKKTNLSKNQLSFFKSLNYWNIINSNLFSDIHEYRKLSLSILKNSLFIYKKLNLNFSNTFISIDILKNFNKFITLYEILSLDTSLNQIKDAEFDLINILSIKNFNSWSLSLLSNGLNNSMESVRKFTLQILFKIIDKSIFLNNLNLFNNIILPSILQSNYFLVTKNDNLSCPYSVLIQNFFIDLFINSNFNSNLIDLILNYLIKISDSFDPIKIYLSLSLLKALKKNKNTLIFNNSHLLLINKLFKINCEDKLFNFILQSIYLNYLFFINSNLITSIDFINSLLNHCKSINDNNQYFTILSNFLPFFKNFAKNNYNIDFINKKLPEFYSDTITKITIDDDDNNLFNFLYSIIFDIPINNNNNNNKFFITQNILLNKEINNNYQNNNNIIIITSDIENILLPLINEIDNTNYDKNSLILIDYINNINLNFLLKNINSKDLFYSIFIKSNTFNINKFEFFVTLFEKIIKNNDNNFLKSLDININDFINNFYNDIIIKQIKLTNDYKLKDKILSIFIKFINLLLLLNSTDNFDNSLLDSIIIDNISNLIADFNSNCEIVNLMNNIINNKIFFNSNLSIKIFNILNLIWSNIFNERLILKQRSLHLSLINTLFNPNLLKFIMFDWPIDSITKFNKISLEIIKSSYSRRGFLPILNKNIFNFIKIYLSLNDDDNNNNTKNLNLNWLIDIMINSFIQEKMPFNIFKLKPIIAIDYDLEFQYLYDDNNKKSDIYNKIYGPIENSSKIHLIDSLIISNNSFKLNFFKNLQLLNNNFLLPIKRNDGLEEIKRLQLWQLSLLTINLLNDNHNNNDYLLNFIFDNNLIDNYLLNEPSPLIRTYKEWFISIIFLKKFDNIKLQDNLFNSLIDHSKPILVLSCERIIYITLVELKLINFNKCELLLKKFLSFLITNATSNKPLVRHFSNSLILSLYPEFFTNNDKVINIDPILKDVIKKLYLNAKQTESLNNKFRTGDALIWNIKKDFNLTSIFGGVLKKITDHDINSYIYENEFNKYLSNDSKLLIDIGKDEIDLWLNKRDSILKNDKNNNNEISINNNESSLINSMNLQTKSGAWETVLDLSTSNNDDKKNKNSSIKRSDLIVISSLVDKPPNLGGICRLCDVLGVGLMTIHDLRIKKHPQFKNVAVTADNWMPMIELPIDNIIEFMRDKKKNEGYTLIGLEQTDNSIELNAQYQFPKKSLILLGTEQFGIPSNLLAELDLCLEIQQHGVIRSMNIQTATAIIVNSYTIQHM